MMRPQANRWLNVRPLLLGLLTMMLIGSPHTAEAQTASEQTVESRKSPWLAFGLSFVITGAGQAYNGQWGKGGVMLGGTAVSAILASTADCDWDFGLPCGGRSAVGFIGILGFSLWSLIDAPITAKAINREIDAGQVSLEVGPRLIPPQGRSTTSSIRPSAFRSSRETLRIDLGLVRMSF